MPFALSQKYTSQNNSPTASRVRTPEQTSIGAHEIGHGEIELQLQWVLGESNVRAKDKMKLLPSVASSFLES